MFLNDITNRLKNGNFAILIYFIRYSQLDHQFRWMHRVRQVEKNTIKNVLVVFWINFYTCVECLTIRLCLLRAKPY